MTAAAPSTVDRTVRVVIGLMSVGLAVLFVRVLQLQLHPSPQLREHMQARITRTSLAPPRGEITDRLGRPMATSEFGFRVFVDPTEIETPDELIPALAEVLQVPADDLGQKIMKRIAENARRLPPKSTEDEKASKKMGLREMLTRLAAAVGAEAPGSDDAETSSLDDNATPLPIRYVRVSEVVSDDTAQTIRKLHLKGVHLEQRDVREYPANGLAASLVGKKNDNPLWNLGAERSHDEELNGDAGLINYVRDAKGRPMWMSPGAYVPARAGQDIRLALDLEIQCIATEELRRGVNDADAAGGRGIVMDPRTGEILAMIDLVRPVPDAVPFPWADARPSDAKSRRRPDYEPEASPAPHQRYITLKPDLGRLIHPALARNRCVEDVYEPGSTFKPFVWSTITELGLAKPNEVFDTHSGMWRTSYGRLIHDVVKKPTMTWMEVLMNSSNIGMTQGGERLSFDQLSGAVRRFGFGSRTQIGLQGETAGLVTPRKLWSKYTQTSVCFGHEIAVTPVQMVRAFCVFARSGELAGTLPAARLTAVDTAAPPLLHRVLRPDVVLMARAIMREVASTMEAKMAANKDHPETGWRYGMFGKSGTAEIPLGKAPAGKRRPPGNKGYFDRQYNASFIGAAPIDQPRLVILVVIDDPGPERVHTNTYYGAHVAGPVVRRIMERSLSYLGVPPAPAPPRDAVHPGGPMAD
jgi:cell division protein FtsI (penicillin-binding protein 3)